MKKVFALLLILAGSLAILDNLNIFSIEPLMDYLWPSFLIVLGLSGLLGRNKNYLFSSVLVLVGSLFLVRQFGWLENVQVTKLMWPAILILVGVFLLWPKSSTPKLHVEVNSDSFKEKSFNDSNRKEYNAILGGLEERIISKDFRSVSITALMGGADIDLRQIEMVENDAYVEVTAIMGGVDMMLPRGYKIEVDGMPILGGFENHCESDPNASKTLHIHYAAVMGGIEIKH